MRAVSLDADGLPELAELPEPTGPGLLVRIHACGLCGSDVEKLGRAATVDDDPLTGPKSGDAMARRLYPLVQTIPAGPALMIVVEPS